MIKNLLLKEEAKKYIYPVPSRSFIINHLNKRDNPVNHKELVKELGITDTYQLEGLNRRLRAMMRDKQLVFTQNHCYCVARHLKLLHGKVIGHRNGFGFLRVKDSKYDYFLSVKQMKMVIHGDVVIAQLNSTDSKGRREARIIEVLVPNNNQIIGRFFMNAGNAFVIPDDNRFTFNILISPGYTQDARIGFIVVVELIQRPNINTKAIGKIVEVLGDNMSVNIAVDIALHTHNIPHIWPPEVNKQLVNLQKEVPEAAKIGRIDLRSLPLVTIDSEDARDFDDAIYCEKKPKGGWRLWVAIADVSYYVRPHTPLDQEANRRATSIYFPSQVIPMIAEVLANGLCSLHPQVDRLCMVCEMTISDNGRLSSYKFYEAVINSHARLTYNKVWKILQGHKDLCVQYARLITPLTKMYEMYQILRKARIRRGGICFETEEAKFILNSEGLIERIDTLKRNDAHKLIEECMILANIAAARFIKKHKEPSLYRIHERPNNDHVKSLRIILEELGLTLGGGNSPRPKDYVKIINLIANRSDQQIIQNIILRSMKQAIYHPENRGHFGLALQAYTHFTSPIRRYSDLIIHRTIKHLLSEKDHCTYTTPSGGWHFEIDEMLQLGQQCSLKERRADTATRDVSDWLKCNFLKKYVGKIFSGVIINITNFGFFVRLETFFIDGLVHISSLKNDYYHYDNIGQRLIGNSSKKVYRLGDVVKIRVEAINIDERKIDFILTSHHCTSNSVSKINYLEQSKTTCIRNKNKLSSCYSKGKTAVY